jgi:hypothetical protein
MVSTVGLLPHPYDDGGGYVPPPSPSDDGGGGGGPPTSPIRTVVARMDPERRWLQLRMGSLPRLIVAAAVGPLPYPFDGGGGCGPPPSPFRRRWRRLRLRWLSGGLAAPTTDLFSFCFVLTSRPKIGIFHPLIFVGQKSMKISLLSMNNSFFRWQKAYFHQLQPDGSSLLPCSAWRRPTGALEPFFSCYLIATGPDCLALT